jgi:hypothetical protein
MQHQWRAIVEIGGIRSVSPREMEDLGKRFVGSIRHEAEHQGGRLFLDWRFTAPGFDDAVDMACVRWRLVVRMIRDVEKSECLDFRVVRTT